MSGASLKYANGYSAIHEAALEEEKRTKQHSS